MSGGDGVKLDYSSYRHGGMQAGCEGLHRLNTKSKQQQESAIFWIPTVPNTPLQSSRDRKENRIRSWKEQTDWKEEADRNGPPRRGPHLLPGLPTNISVTAGRLATLPCRVANLKGRSVSRDALFTCHSQVGSGRAYLSARPLQMLAKTC
ncbi:hypothetical protein O3P69_005328 [Scylla paramamosain]|uniref:Ig-like domain-containing protein n=1 Tax=Scylla paramamosain TaxID=85552 RepID=A0AAW0U9I2_SCYPA